jgi:anti-sigma regulatory factor (Ser/Thr protein kinase)
MTLARDLDAPAMARAAVAGWLAGQVDEPALGDAQQLVGALVANSVRHAAGPDGATVSVRVEIRGDALHLEVQDGGTSGSIVRRTVDLHAPPAGRAAEERRAAAAAALMRAERAHRRASAARQARDQATTEYARRSQSRVADLNAAIARHHEDLARRLRLGADSDPGAA